MKLRRAALFVAMFCLAAPLTAWSLQGGANRGVAEATINGKKVTINYGRPKLNGRDTEKDLLGQMKIGQAWRLGMNEKTVIDSAGDLMVAGKQLKAGKYSLWVKKTGDNNYVLGFHPKADGWGAPPLTEGYVAELPLTLGKAADSAEELVIGLADKGGNAEINIHWGTATLTGSFGVK